MPDRILILQTKRIGDLVLTAPLVASIRRQIPQAEITLLAQGIAGRLAPLIPGADDCLVLQPGKFHPWPWLDLWGREFDAAIDLSATDRSRIALELSGAKKRIGFEKWQRRRLFGVGPLYNQPIPGDIGKRHITRFFATSLEGLGLEPVLEPAQLNPPPGLDSVTEQLTSIKKRAKVALIHPGTTEPGKFWRPEHWARTIEHMVKEHGCAVILSQGPHPMEQHHLDAIRRHLTVPLALDESCSLEELVLWVEHCDIALGVDTGSMHIAALAGRKQVVLFTPKHAIQWAPEQPNARVLTPSEGPNVVNISPEDVMAAADGLLAGEAA